MKKVQPIILDTNAVMAVAEFKVDIFAELERIMEVPFQICVVERTINELEKIMETQRLRFSRAAKLGLMLLKVKKVKVLPGKDLGKVDDMLVDYSHQGALVLTQDRELKKRLKRPFLTIRERKKVMMVR